MIQYRDDMPLLHLDTEILTTTLATGNVAQKYLGTHHIFVYLTMIL